MNLLMTDTPLSVPLPPGEGNRYVDLSQLNIHNCVGCFGCWVKTPGRCVIRDDAVKVYPLIAASSRVIYVSRLYCGSYDTVMKTMLERAIPVQQAFIRLHQGETHHVQRRVGDKQAVIVAYGAKDQEERDIFSRLVERNAKNMCFRDWQIRFVDPQDLEETVAREVAAWTN